MLYQFLQIFLVSICCIAIPVKNYFYLLRSDFFVAFEQMDMDRLEKTHLPIHNLVVAMFYPLISFVRHYFKIRKTLRLYDKLDNAVKTADNIALIDIGQTDQLYIKMLCYIKHRL